VNEAVIVARAGIVRDYSVALKRAGLVVAEAMVLGTGYFLATQLGLGFRFANSQIGVVWPANAVVLSALLLTPRKRWWTVFVVVAPVHALVMNEMIPAWRWLWQIAGNSAFTMATAELLRRYAGLPLHLESRRQVFTFAGITFLAAALFAFTTPTFVRSLFGLEVVFDPFTALLRTTLTNATAILMIVPVAALWANDGIRRLSQANAGRLVEGSVIIWSLVAIGLVAFGTGSEITRFPSLLLLVFLPLLWASVRTGPLGASTTVLGAAALSVWGTARQLGPFVAMADSDRVMSLHLFWILMWAPAVLLAAVIREREQAEEALHEQRNQLAQVTRLATVGELSGALAHELRQPLMSILANAQAATRLLSLEAPDVPEVRKILKDIAEDDKHAAGVIGRMRSFVGEGPSRFEPVAIESVVRDALALSRSTLELSEVSVETKIPPGLPHVHGDPVQLLQVVLNLVVNGCESMSGIPVAERRLTMHAAPVNGSYVELMVSDAGAGLPRGVENRVFDPLFTTKENGLGLGLSICRSIVTAHGGRLWAENNPHRGATFHLILHTESAHGSTALDSGSG